MGARCPAGVPPWALPAPGSKGERGNKKSAPAAPSVTPVTPVAPCVAAPCEALAALGCTGGAPTRAPSERLPWVTMRMLAVKADVARAVKSAVRVIGRNRPRTPEVRHGDSLPAPSGVPHRAPRDLRTNSTTLFGVVWEYFSAFRVLYVLWEGPPLVVYAVLLLLEFLFALLPPVAIRTEGWLRLEEELGGRLLDLPSFPVCSPKRGRPPSIPCGSCCVFLFCSSPCIRCSCRLCSWFCGPVLLCSLGCFW